MAAAGRSAARPSVSRAAATVRRPRQGIAAREARSRRPRCGIQRAKRAPGSLAGPFSGRDRLPGGGVTTGGICRGLLAGRALPPVAAAGFRAARKPTPGSKRRQGRLECEFGARKRRRGRKAGQRAARSPRRGRRARETRARRWRRGREAPLGASERGARRERADWTVDGRPPLRWFARKSGGLSSSHFATLRTPSCGSRGGSRRLPWTRHHPRRTVSPGWEVLSAPGAPRGGRPAGGALRRIARRRPVLRLGEPLRHRAPGDPRRVRRTALHVAPPLTSRRG